MDNWSRVCRYSRPGGQSGGQSIGGSIQTDVDEGAVVEATASSGADAAVDESSIAAGASIAPVTTLHASVAADTMVAVETASVSMEDAALFADSVIPLVVVVVFSGVLSSTA